MSTERELQKALRESCSFSRKEWSFYRSHLALSPQTNGRGKPEIHSWSVPRRNISAAIVDKLQAYLIHDRCVGIRLWCTGVST
jgi:hypothetical protein